MVIIEQSFEERLSNNFITKLFDGALHYMTLNFCGNPLCECGVALMEFYTKTTLNESYIEYKVPIDITDETVKDSSYKGYYCEPGNNEQITEFLSDALDTNDWKTIKKTYHECKFDLVENINPDEIDYDFDISYYLDVSKLVPYLEVFPYSGFRIELDKENYLISDNLCKNPSCTCTTTYLAILECTENLEKNIGDIEYDYKTGAATFNPKSKDDEDKFKRILAELKEQYKDFNKKVSIRSKNLKAIYKKSRAKRLQKTIPMYSKPQIGRNDLCYCGSGKKYKKCCMNK